MITYLCTKPYIFVSKIKKERIIMQLKKEIEKSLEQIRILEERFRYARNSEILPISFFSASYDIIRELAGTLHYIEQEQLKFMQEQFIANKISFLETTDSLSKTKPVEIFPETGKSVEELFEEELENSFFSDNFSIEIPQKEEEEIKKEEKKEVPVETRILTDTRKYMSLNDKFRFQREIFMGSAEEMNRIFDILNKFSTITDTWSFIESQPWYSDDSEIIAEFKELIGKRFS